MADAVRRCAGQMASSQFNRLVVCLLLSFTVLARPASSLEQKHDLCEFIPIKRLTIETNHQNVKSALSEDPGIENIIADRIFAFNTAETKKLISRGIKISNHLLYKMTGYETDQSRYSCAFSFDVGLDATDSDIKILNPESQFDPTYRPRFFAENPQARRGHIAFIQYDIHLSYTLDYQLDYISIKKIDLNFVPSAMSAISTEEAKVHRLKQHFSRRVVIKAPGD